MPTPKSIIEAEAFVLTDADGVTRGELTVKNGDPRLELNAAVWRARYVYADHAVIFIPPAHDEGMSQIEIQLHS